MKTPAAVDGCGIVQFARDRLQAGDVNDDIIADLLPGIDEDQHPECQMWILQPWHFAEAELPQKGVDHAVRSEEHTSELQSLMRISYAVFCLKKKTITI